MHIKEGTEDLHTAHIISTYLRMKKLIKKQEKQIDILREKHKIKIQELQFEADEAFLQSFNGQKEIKSQLALLERIHPKKSPEDNGN